ncbi:MAG: hypothetical protein KBT46_06315, partial [Ruminococcus sp.]|nr:hypothetical protein [Candidatus Copronaster equi]
MINKNAIIRIVSVVVALTVIVTSASGCNLVKQSAKTGTNASDMALNKDELCCPMCSSTDITGPDD